jgi:hypothetical protein
VKNVMYENTVNGSVFLLGKFQGGPSSPIFYLPKKVSIILQ